MTWVHQQSFILKSDFGNAFSLVLGMQGTLKDDTHWSYRAQLGMQASCLQSPRHHHSLLIITTLLVKSLHFNCDARHLPGTQAMLRR